MPNRLCKPFTLPKAKVAAKLAARAEDLLKANRDVAGAAYDRLDAIEREASYHQAGSKEAALFQIGLLARTGARLAEASLGEVDRLLATHARLSESLATYLEAVTGVRREDCRVDFYLPRGGEQIARRERRKFPGVSVVGGDSVATRREATPPNSHLNH